MPKKCHRAEKCAAADRSIFSRRQSRKDHLYVGMRANRQRGKDGRSRGRSRSDQKPFLMRSRELSKRVAARSPIAFNHIFLKDLADYQAMNEMYKTYFPTDPPARYCICADLVRPDWLVEIASIAHVAGDSSSCPTNDWGFLFGLGHNHSLSRAYEPGLTPMNKQRSISVPRISVRDFVSAGPGTYAGQYLRKFWQPVYHSIDLLPERPIPLRIMSESFTLYRGAVERFFSSITAARIAAPSFRQVGSKAMSCVASITAGNLPETGSVFSSRLRRTLSAIKSRYGVFLRASILGLFLPSSVKASRPSFRVIRSSRILTALSK